MKKFRKLLFFAAITALLTCLLCMALSATQYSGNCGKDGNNVTWSLDTETGVLKIEGTGAMADYSSGYTPWNSYNSSINSVEISDGVTTIGKNSIKYTNAVSISMPESITRIESAGFEGNEKLLNIVIPANVEYIGDHAFNNCTSLENITFEKDSKLAEISSAAFGYCKKLRSLEIPASVTSIATSSSGFVYGNYSMTSLTVADGNTVYHSKNNCIIETATKSLIAGCKTSTIPTDGSVVVIESGAFDRSGISSIVIPESVTDIKMWTFGSCDSLKKITILNKDTNIANDINAIYAGATIVGYSGSTAEAYATKYSRTFVALKNIVASGKCGENLEWSLDDEGLLTIEGTGEMEDYSYGTSPWYNYRESIKSVEISAGVTSIGSTSFYCCENLESVSIPSSVTRIESDVFRDCIKINSINIPTNVTKIGCGAFINCKSLTSIEIPNGISKIEWQTFSGCSALVTVIIPCNLESIESHAFYGCNSLKNITLPAGITSIEEYTFYKCTSLTSIIIPQGVTSICREAFYDCNNLTSVTMFEGVESIELSAFYGCKNLKDITIPSSVASLESSAFGGCDNLKYNEYDNALYLGNSDNPYVILIKAKNKYISSCNIYEKTRCIYDNAFFGCTYLLNITIPSNVLNIGYWAFLSCYNLSTITVEEGNTVYHSDGNCLIETASKTLIVGSNNSIIPSDGSVVTIASYSFDGKNNLTNINIPDTVTKIGMCAFRGCSSLKSICIPYSVVSIGSDAFNGCSDLKSITVEKGNSVYHSTENCLIKTESKELIAGCINSIIPSDGSVTTIKSGAFFCIYNLGNIIIPKSIKNIEVSAFNGCNGLSSITILSKDVAIYDYDGTISSTATIYGYSGSTAEAYATKYNRKFVAIIANGKCGENLEWMLDETGLLTIEGTGEMDDYPSRNIPWYEYRSSVKSVEIRDGVTSIGSYAFSVCNSLMSITIPDSVTRIGNGVFVGCDDLTSITFGENSQLTSIGDDAFELCCSITGISIPNNMISIGSRAFQSCRSLTDITIPNSVISIGDNAFYDCSSLTSINVDESNKNYKSINGVLFTKDEEILIAYPAAKSETTYIIPSGVTSIRSSAFFGCSSLTSVEIPSSVTSIGSSAFYNCSSLTSIEIPSGVTSIKANTFSGCNSLTSVKIPTSVTSIEDYAFRGCDFTSIEIPNSVTNIGLGAFYACGNLTSIEIPSGVTSIRRDTFTGCGLTSITISNSVTSIEDYAFSGCGLTSIEIPSSVTSIGMYAFEGCSSLASITMHSGVTYIGCGAFYGCSRLTGITIPDSILDIDWRTLSVCDSLVSITILSKDTVIYDSADAIPDTATIYGYKGSTAEAYATKYDRKFIAIDRYDSINANATLNENITMNFIGAALTKEDVDGNDFKMTFVMNGSKTSVSPVEKNGKYTFPFADIAPQCMNDEISYEMTMNGVVVKQGSTSVSGYLKKLIETKPDNMTDTKFKAMSTLVSDMLNYGSAAQAYTGHSTDSLLNENYYDDIEKNYTELESTDKALSGTAPVGAKFTNVGVRFDNVNKVFFRFTADDVSKVIITINGVAYGQDKFVKTGDKYTVYSEDILASKFDTVYTAILTYTGTDEKQMMTYSVKSFAYSFQNKRGEDGKLTVEAVLARATYTYGVSAKAYENAK